MVVQSSKRRVAHFAVILMAVAGCAAQPAQQASAPTPSAPTPSAPTLAAAPAPTQGPATAGGSRFDGLYRGNVSTVGGGSSRYVCPPITDGNVRVRGGVVTRNWRGGLVQATVQPDGSFSGSGGVARMRGQITGDHMVMDIL